MQSNLFCQCGLLLFGFAFFCGCVVILFLFFLLLFLNAWIVFWCFYTSRTTGLGEPLSPRPRT
jgi:hypothetical protein